MKRWLATALVLVCLAALSGCSSGSGGGSLISITAEVGQRVGVGIARLQVDDGPAVTIRSVELVDRMGPGPGIEVVHTGLYSLEDRDAVGAAYWGPRTGLTRLSV